LKSGLDARLAKLESASDYGRVVFLWQPNTMEELNDLMRSRGVGPGDTVHLFRWEDESPLE